MRVEILTADWCGKCRQAKEILRDFDISWIDVMSEDGKELMDVFYVENIPTMIVYYDDGTLQVTECVFCVKNYLEGKTDKVKDER